MKNDNVPKFFFYFIFCVRILFAILVPLNPFIIALISCYLDWSDLRTIKGFGISLKGYNFTDKLTDSIIYLIIFIYILAIPTDLYIKIVFAILFFIRNIGYLLYLLTEKRKFFFLFPNIFFTFFVVFSALLFFNINITMQLFIVLLILSSLFQLYFEYGYHVGKNSLTEAQLDTNNQTWITKLVSKYFK